MGRYMRPVTLLRLLDVREVSFRDDSHRWVVVKRFEVVSDAGPDPFRSLRALLVHAEYRHGFPYASAGKAGWTWTIQEPYGKKSPVTVKVGEPSIPRPLSARCPVADAFEPLPPESLVQVFRWWLDNQFDPPAPIPPPGLIEGDFDAVFDELAAATACFRLRDIGEAGFHDDGWVMSDSEEYVVMQPDGLLVVVMAGSD